MYALTVIGYLMLQANDSQIYGYILLLRALAKLFGLVFSGLDRILHN